MDDCVCGLFSFEPCVILHEIMFFSEILCGKAWVALFSCCNPKVRTYQNPVLDVSRST